MSLSRTSIRYTGIDSLRGWLIILVMLGHLVLGSVHENFIRYSIYAFHMPLFIGLTGYLINPDTLKRSSCLDIGLRYWWRVLFPFAFAFTFYTVILVFHAFEEGRVTTRLLLATIHTPYYHLWFVPTLVLWVIAFALFLKSRVPLIAILLCFLLATFFWAAVPRAEQWDGLAPLLSKKVIYFFSFFLFGAWLRTSNSRRFRALFSDFKVLPISLILACAGLYLLDISVSKSAFKAAVWLVFNIALITLLIDAATSNPKAKPSIVSDIGRDSLPIYLWHVVPLFILKGFDVHETHPLLYYFVASIAMVLIVFAVLCLKDKHRWLNRGLFGAD